MDPNPTVDEQTSKLQFCKDAIINLTLQKGQDEGVLFELRNEKRLLEKERESILKTLAQIEADMKEVEKTELELTAVCSTLADEISRRTEFEYEPLRTSVNLQRAQNGLPPVSSLQDDIDQNLAKRLSEKRERWRDLEDVASNDSLEFGVSSSTGSTSKRGRKKKRV
ncbi:hypothetical protein BCR33DRAFT_714091 [Rhizoclosmatium globosum]|uniref:Uncharacterized protein n=1 Tax=Rhizoclosmatium globosum TaxID=329046 RepID=A0A1Y2CRN8_9FUNG|nr:hypothetical protein BCR33DRAFT_714091 [Rhizoclosmatium globosum]|eukprot:ORY49015.1 hypothetical protein BCR33DRAFT_714091 [Rhizoclosmatium globosum]